MSDGARVLVVNANAGSVDERLRDLLRDLLPGYRELVFPDAAGEIERLPAGSRVAVCGGDGTITQVARALSGRGHELAIIPAGTFNNVARSLGIPLDPEEAARLAATGRGRPCAVGIAGETVFMEAALLGALGNLLVVGEAAKEGRLVESIRRFRRMLSLGAFRFSVTGDVSLKGRATSLILANTPTTGSQLQLATVDPLTAELELRVQRRRPLTWLLRHLVRRPRAAPSLRVRRVTIETWPPVPVVCDAVPSGTTPVEVRIWPDAISIVVPSTPPGASH